ncbi:hypothetical protein CEV32_3951 [Brucella rhizosphaerae]|uniref:Uncharacterized protein n=1 Tax=Brucella rhizosphaerae TaxID=571254 RepID=A0A256FQM5_9HYPH|nr:hypothetical protein CEV32_3951 [Brucella rhizosphaerae]
MHRAGVDRPLGHRLGPFRRGGRVEIAFRVGQELLPAPGRAEVIGPTRVLGLVRGLVGIDHHAADRVLDLVGTVRCDSRVPLLMAVGRMIVVLMIVFSIVGHFYASSASRPRPCVRRSALSNR